MEAMACGLCIVRARPSAGGIRRLLEDGEDALITPCGDDEAMAAAVRHPLRTGLGNAPVNARRKAEILDWSIVLPAVDQELRLAAARGATR